jgi:hypothetical protein
MITRLRRWIARALALFVFVVTFGRVQVNRTGGPTATDAGRQQSHVAASHRP